MTGVSSACPVIVEYTAAVEQQGDDELQALPKDGVVRSRFMPDYGQLRDGARACARSR